MKELWIEIGYGVLLAIIIICGTLLVESTNWNMVIAEWPYNLDFEIPSGWSDAIICP